MYLVKQLKKIIVKDKCYKCGDGFKTMDSKNKGLCIKCNIEAINEKFKCVCK